MPTPFFCTLNSTGILSATGLESKKFLQGQLTCNINYLSPLKTSLGARCNSKGRMVSNFRIINTTENHYLLSINSSLLEKQLTDLKKYAIFSKVTLADISTQWTIFALYGEDNQLTFLNREIPIEINQVTHNKDCYLVKVSTHLFTLYCPKHNESTIKNLLNQHLPEEPVNNWSLALIRAGLGAISLETSELFIPQMINLQTLGGVSFKKGCYTGQEIVARMQYLGKLKRHLYRFSCANNIIPNKATAIISSERHNRVGEVVIAAHTESQSIELLAVIQDEALHFPLWLEHHEAEKLTLQPLPYTSNLEEEIKQ